MISIIYHELVATSMRHLAECLRDKQSCNYDVIANILMAIYTEDLTIKSSHSVGNQKNQARAAIHSQSLAANNTE